MPDPRARSGGGSGGVGRNPAARERLVGGFIIAAWIGAGFLAAGGVASRLGASVPARDQHIQQDFCVRPEPGSAVPEPLDLRSRDGVLQVDLAIRNSRQPDGSIRYCYVTPDGALSPNLRVKPGDLLILRLSNNLTDLETASSAPLCVSKEKSDPCAGGAMTAVSANLHFHGLTAPPVCHQDDVLKTSIQPGDPPFEYRLRIPADEPPGLYWYHPHIHGYGKAQVLGGASGALIIEGVERTNPALAGLPERVLIIRDKDLLNPDAPPSKSEPTVPKNQVDSDGDTVNNGSGFGKPAKDLSVNFVPVPYPDYPVASLAIKPRERQLWRVLNASAITYLNLALLFRHAAQPLGVVAIDGRRSISTAVRLLQSNGSITLACRRAPEWNSLLMVRPWARRRCW